MAKVLVVEDNPLLCFRLTDEIEAAGHRIVGPAPSTGAALVEGRVKKPAVALIDLDLEHVHDSLELARVLKEMVIPRSSTRMLKRSFCPRRMWHWALR